ncbi:MAG: hypothetical protein H0T46_14560 [Deltaproteobacteria bacterium]|nr:hypothetical protein [Deltaproteobacteria bacterium]
MIRLAPILFAAACVSTSSSEPPVLPSDAYFTGVPSQFSSTEECLANSRHPYGWDCSFELAFCHTGAAGYRQGDVITVGTYQLDDGLAVGKLGASPFQFDLETSTALTDSFGGGLTWVPDTAGRWTTFQFDVISCDD